MTTATEQTSAAALAPVTAQPGERYASRRLAQVRTRQGASSMTDDDLRAGGTTLHWD